MPSQVPAIHDLNLAGNRPLLVFSCFAPPPYCLTTWAYTVSLSRPASVRPACAGRTYGCSVRHAHPYRQPRIDVHTSPDIHASANPHTDGYGYPYGHTHRHLTCYIYAVAHHCSHFHPDPAPHARRRFPHGTRAYLDVSLHFGPPC